MNAIKDINIPEDCKVLVHGDLYSRHLLFDKGKLSGIIDWGDTAINHACVDLAVVFSFFPSECQEAFLEIYGDVDPENWQYARFLGLYSSLTVMLYAHDVGDMALFEEAKRSAARVNPDVFWS